MPVAEALVEQGINRGRCIVDTVVARMRLTLVVGRHLQPYAALELHRTQLRTSPLERHATTPAGRNSSHERRGVEQVRTDLRAYVVPRLLHSGHQHRESLLQQGESHDVAAGCHIVVARASPQVEEQP